MPRRDKRNCDDNPFEKGCHAPDLKKLAIDCLTEYFKDKSWFVGGPIPDRVLFSDSSIKTVLRTQFDHATFSHIHDMCLPRIRQPSDYTETSVPWSVAFLIRLLNSMKSRSVPKEFQPGFALLYFHFCVGCPIPKPPLL